MKAQILTLALTALLGLQAQAELRCHIQKENPQVQGAFDQTLWTAPVNPVKGSQVNIYVLADGRALTQDEMVAEAQRLANPKQVQRFLKSAKIFSIGGVDVPEGYMVLSITEMGEKPTGAYAIGKADKFFHLADSERGYALNCTDLSKY
ncbi:MAG: hypothetical protein KF767_14105 [Bdellovibrionaceae bacterium]|nr:hypothetical protein [Pseudobdellovibrionaceae bacterium]